INIGDCHEHDGKLTAAYADYQRARVLNPGTQPADRRPALDGLIQEGLVRLGAWLPRLRIVVDKPLVGLVVRQDGKDVPPGAFGSDLPVEPGAHEVNAEAPGFVPQKYTVSLREGEKQTVRVALSPPPESIASRYAGAIGASAGAVVLGGVAAGF